MSHTFWKHIANTYGMSIADYETLHKQQFGKCAICGRKEPGSKSGLLEVDHCHRTGKIRGLLCRKCNHGIGILGDAFAALAKAAAYLARAEGECVITSQNIGLGRRRIAWIGQRKADIEARGAEQAPWKVFWNDDHGKRRERTCKDAAEAVSVKKLIEGVLNSHLTPERI